MALYEPTILDKAVSAAFKYLSTHKVITQVSFAKESGIDRTVVNNMVNLRRGIPEHKRELVVHILTGKYGVRREFLSTNSGPIVKEPLPIEAGQVPQYDALLIKFKELEKKCKDLENQNTYLSQIVNTQKELIKHLKK